MQKKNTCQINNARVVAESRWVERLFIQSAVVSDVAVISTTMVIPQMSSLCLDT